MHLEILADAMYEEPLNVQRGGKTPYSKEVYTAAQQLIKMGLLESNPQGTNNLEVRRTEAGFRVLRAWHKAGFLPDASKESLVGPLVGNGKWTDCHSIEVAILRFQIGDLETWQLPKDSKT